MDAGRELDALIAEQVMGWEAVHKDPLQRWGNFPMWRNGERWFNRNEIPPYSTDIAAAWQVVEKLAEADRHCSIKSVRYGPRWVCSFGNFDSNDWVVSDADSATLAICRAALVAVGAEIPA